MTTIGNARVKDAIIDWHVNSSNRLDLIAVLEEDIPSDSDFEPVEGDTEDKAFLSKIDGLYRGWQKPSPVSEETSQSYSRSTLELENGSVEVYHMLPHVVKGRLQDQGKDVMKVDAIINFKRRPIRSAVLDIEKVEDIINKFINGDEGNENNSFWYWRHNNTKNPPFKDDTKYPVTAEAELEKNKYDEWLVKKK